MMFLVICMMILLLVVSAAAVMLQKRVKSLEDHVQAMCMEAFYLRQRIEELERQNASLSPDPEKSSRTMWS